jgi:hypothetical protein
MKILDKVPVAASGRLSRAYAVFPIPTVQTVLHKQAG